jgi:polysaccharide biosynthesis/export protein
MKCRAALVVIFLTLLEVSGVAPPAFGGGGQAKPSSVAETLGAQEGTAFSSTYVIGPADVLEIDVWKEPAVTRTVPVRPDGKISLPLLQDVQAAGLTPAELGSKLTEQFKKFFTAPEVTVIVTQMNSQRIYILGEVNHPGPQALLPKMTVLQALSDAGGLSDFANRKKIYVLRKKNGSNLRLPFNFKKAVQGQGGGQDIVLQPGDTIVVP